MEAVPPAPPGRSSTSTSTSSRTICAARSRELGAAGLSGDESFLVAIKRIGGVNELSREFARERSSRLWKQLVLAGDTVRERSGRVRRTRSSSVCFAIGAALAFKLPALFGIDPFASGDIRQREVEAEASFYLRNARCWRCRFSSASSPGSAACRCAWSPGWPCPSSPPRSWSTSSRSTAAATRRCWRPSTCRYSSGSSPAWPTWAAPGGPMRRGWTSCASPASGSSTTR